MKKYILFLNFILFLAVSVGNYFYITGGELVVKSITSVLFELAGGVNLAYVMSQKSGRIGFAVCLVSGLFFSMLGDILLGISFIGGAALFAVGHIMFLLSYGKIMPFCKADFIIGGAIFIRNNKDRLRGICLYNFDDGRQIAVQYGFAKKYADHCDSHRQCTFLLFRPYARV